MSSPDQGGAERAQVLVSELRHLQPLDVDKSVTREM